MPNKFEVINKNFSKKKYIAIILDKSGSMGCVKDITIKNFNEQIQTIRSQADQNTYASLILFSHKVTPLFLNKTPSELQELNDDTYQPNGTTALYDAIGFVIDEFSKLEGCDYLVCIVTDGQENASTTYNRQFIRDKIKELEQKNWTFTFLGANVNLEDVAQEYGINVRNVLSYTPDAFGTQVAFCGQTNCLSNYIQNTNRGIKTSSFYGKQDNVFKCSDNVLNEEMEEQK